MVSLKKEKKVALQAAKDAARVLLRHFGKKESIKVKPNKSLVGVADVEANDAKHFLMPKIKWSVMKC
jgi:fructose-1,6-bisphosphatase/inositol monophosphatase family enzyme